MNNKISRKVLFGYKIIMAFVVPALLLIIVGSVITRNKPAAMQSALLASGLANLIILGFITNVFISLGIEYIKFKNSVEWERGNKSDVYIIIGKNICWGLFNLIYLMLLTLLFSDVVHWFAPGFFFSSDFIWNIDLGGFFLSVISAILLSVSMALIITTFVKNEYIFAGIGLLYFLAFGYLAGGMFGPGATQWMLWPSLLLPHAYVAHFMAGAFTSGTYVIAHMPSFNDILVNSIDESALQQFYTELGDDLDQFMDIVNSVQWDKPLQALDGFNRIKDLLSGLTITPLNIDTSPEAILHIYVQHDSSIWDLSVMSPWEFVDENGVRWTSASTGPKYYSSFYQLNALNIFVPIVTWVSCFTAWAAIFYKPNKNIEKKKI